MKSTRQRRAEIKAQRLKRAMKRNRSRSAPATRDAPPPGSIAADHRALSLTDTACATTPEAPPRLDLAARYPACFNWQQPHPLKVGIREDLVAEGHPPKAIRRALGAYCSRVKYLKALRAATPRIDLHGQPSGTVTEADEAVAQAKFAGTWTPPSRPGSAAPAGQPPPDLPLDAPLSEDTIVTGRLELSV